mmetsp:Transcript_12347/g.18974  ORF Transcript_12347/g.18974 Transcript_12347/m.18974 type:complete len:308 (+) Transcript_12347:52-975(+)
MRMSLSRRFLTILLLLVAVQAVDWFDSFDANHDGSINHEEFDQGLQKLSAALNGPVPTGTASTGSWFPSQSSAGSFWKGFTSSVAMIIATEIGDKTFFIAAVLSMRHDRSAVFGGAILALIIMTILSSAMGLVLPQFLPREYTHILGGILFLYFGVKLIVDSRQMEANKVSEELEEVEEELGQSNKKQDDEEKGSTADGPSPPSGNATKVTNSGKPSMGWYPVFLQSLTLTFLAEWGDRSQIATIALAAAKNPIGVTVGGCLGHSICTGGAVIGGRMLASRISEKTVSFWGGCIFLVFGFHSLFFET